MRVCSCVRPCIRERERSTRKKDISTPGFRLTKKSGLEDPLNLALLGTKTCSMFNQRGLMKVVNRWFALSALRPSLRVVPSIGKLSHVLAIKRLNNFNLSIVAI